jgi:Ca-activated chloride channel homolog
MKAYILILASAWAGLWFTPDQQGRRHFERSEFVEAAETFHEPLWQGVAWYRAGEFRKAAQALAQRDTPEAHYNQGNARVMLGQYETAMACYDRALERRPGWREATENRALAAARAEALDIEGGNMTEGKLGADKILFDSGKKGPDAQTTEIAGGKALSDQEIQALWLRRVHTSPADFLKAKFAYQEAVRAQGGGR